MAHVELITGPAGSGKTRRVLQAYREHVRDELRQGRFSTALWITPSRWSQQEVLGSLLASEASVCLDPRVETFGQFAERVLASAGDEYQPLSQVGRRKLIRDIVDGLHRARKLVHFGPVAGTKGFLDLCVNFIGELKREEVWPEHFQDAFRKLEGKSEDGESPAISRRIAELALIYATYQQRLHGGPDAENSDNQPVPGQVYDTEGRFWIARTLIERGHRGPYADTSLIVVDGFTDFTSPQIKILRSLAATAGRVMITLQLDEHDRRADLFSKCLATRQALRIAVKKTGVRETALQLPHDNAQPAFTHIARHLFDNPRETPTLPQASHCEILACVRAGGEIDAVVKRIKQRLLDGIPPEQIVVVFRNLNGVSEQIRAACESAKIPAATQSGPPILAAGSVRMALSLLELEREDWSHSRLMGLLNSTLFRPDWEPNIPREIVRRIGFVSRRENIDRGRRPLLAQFERLAAREAEEGKTNGELWAAATLLNHISDELRVLRDRVPFSAWVDRWLAVCRAFGFAPRSDAGDEKFRWLQIEQSGWNALLRLIEDARKSESLTPGEPRALTLDRFRDQVLELVGGQNTDPPVSERGRVRILAADQARHLDIEHLFVCGLGEGIFPQGRSEDCLLGEADRKRLGEVGVALDHRARQAAEEMLLFYGVVTRARRSLTLSYSSVNDKGETLNASPYLDAILRLFEPAGSPVTIVGRLDPVPETRADCASEADIRLVATRELLEGAGGLWSSLAGRPESRETMLNVASAFDMAVARFATRGLTNYEGVLDDPRNLKRLRQRFGPHHEFSVTELECYATDPFEFFLTSVLGVDSTTEPGPRTDRLQRGITLHNSLAALHRRFHEDGQRPTRDELLAALRQEIADRHHAGGDSALLRALRAIEGEIITGYSDRYIVQWEQYIEVIRGLWDAAPQPRHFEIAFGNTPAEEGDEDAEDPNPTVEFGTGGDIVRVRGRIDRIDIGSADGEPVFNIVDYKLAKNLSRFSEEDLESGRALQLVVYAAAARRLGLIAGDLYQFGYWGLEEKGFTPGMKSKQRKLARLEDEFRQSMEERLDELLPGIVESIRSGHFAPATKDDGRTFAAPYRAVARTASLRAVADHLEKFPATSGEVDVL